MWQATCEEFELCFQFETPIVPTYASGMAAMPFTEQLAPNLNTGSVLRQVLCLIAHHTT